MIQSIWDYIVSAFTKPNLQRNILDDITVGVISMFVVVAFVFVAAYASVLIDNYKRRMNRAKQ